ncbi:retrotransposon protein, putative, ty1-copia subclass [Tanacetum coccineum]
MDIGSVLCPTCQSDVETVNHIFFNCDLAKDLWALLVKCVVVVRPVNTRHRWDETCLLDIIVIKSTDVVGMALPVQNINHSAFRSMFEKEKLSGNNFNDWFARLKLVLRVEKKMHVIEQPLPPAPEAGVEPNIVAQWTALYDDHTEIACLMLGRSLDRMLRTSWSQRSLTYPIFPACKQEEGKSLMTMSLRERICGANGDVWLLHNTGYLCEIQAYAYEYEKGLPKKAEMNTTSKNKGNGKGKDKKVYIPKPNNPKSTAKERPAKDDACHHFLRGFRIEWKLKKELFTCTCGGNACCVNKDCGISVPKNGVLYFNVVPRNGIYEIDMHDLVPNVNSIYNVSNKRVKHNLDSTYLWHCRLAHINKKRIKQLQQDRLLKSTDDESFDKCKSCLSGKMTKKPFLHSNERALKISMSKLVLLKGLGGEALVKRDTPDKLEQRYVKCIFIGYPKETISYYFYFSPENKIVVARSEEQIEAPNRLCLNVEVEEHSLGDLNEPTSYKAAMLDSESNKWIDAMNAEIQSMMDNMVWVSGDRFVDPNHPRKVCKLQRSIYGLKQASRSWNKRFDEEIKRFGFAQNLDEPCVYQKASGSNVTFLILYVDDIIIMGNHIPSLQSVKDYLGKCFAMKDLGEAAFILGIKIYRDRSKRLIGLGQNAYMDKILKRYKMDNSKRGHIPMQERLDLNKTQGASTPEEVKRMQNVPYASAVGSIMYAVRCTRPDVAFANTKDMFLVYGGNPEAELRVDCYCDTGFETDIDDMKSQTGYVSF